MTFIIHVLFWLGLISFIIKIKARKAPPMRERNNMGYAMIAHNNYYDIFDNC